MFTLLFTFRTVSLLTLPLLTLPHYADLPRGLTGSDTTLHTTVNLA